MPLPLRHPCEGRDSSEVLENPPQGGFFFIRQRSKSVIPAQAHGCPE